MSPESQYKGSHRTTTSIAWVNPQATMNAPKARNIHVNGRFCLSQRRSHTIVHAIVKQETKMKESETTCKLSSCLFHMWQKPCGRKLYDTIPVIVEGHAATAAAMTPAMMTMTQTFFLSCGLRIVFTSSFAQRNALFQRTNPPLSGNITMKSQLTVGRVQRQWL